MDRVARRGPLTRASGALKGEDTSEIVNIFVAVEALWRKNKFSKKKSQCRKTEKGDPLGFFNIHSVAKHRKNAGGPFGEKNFRKKVSQCRKTERGTLWGFQHPFCRKTSKNWRMKIFILGKKISQCRKKLKGRPFGIFQHPFCRKTSKKCRGPFGGKISEKKSRSAEKNERGTFWSRPVWYVTRKNRKNLFDSVR